MGNSSSSHHQHRSSHHPHHHGGKHTGGFPRYPYPQHPYGEGWTHHHSLEHPESRNRMKRGYYISPRAYPIPVGHSMPPPMKVLPQPVNPNKLLKATSNGAILQSGGTISGRKISEIELEINRKRSTMSCPGNGMEHGLSSGRSTPNLLTPRMGITAAGFVASSSSSKSPRDYGSEPDLRDIGRPKPHHSEDTGTDDPDHSPGPNSFTLIQESPAKKQIRSRKKSKAPPPPSQSHPNDLMANGFMGHPYQYRLQQDPHRQLLLTPVHPMMIMNGNHSGTDEKKKSRLFKTKAESRSQSALNSPALKSSTPKSNNKIELKSSQAIDRQLSNDKIKKEKPVKNSTKQETPSSGNKVVPKHHQQSLQEEKKKTFYFGMHAGTFKQKNDEEGQTPSLKQAHVADLHKEISRRKMMQKIEGSPANSRSSSRNQENPPAPVTKAIIGPPATKPEVKKSISSNIVSESDSDGIHRRQDSGTFDIKDKKGAGLIANGQKKDDKNVAKTTGKPRESSSDLSSSELDVPVVVTRPTLPQKKLELPRFSPTSAWRSIESPSRGSNNSNSGRSFEIDSSEEGRLHRFTRPSAPPRISAERSGDSGISAGGSPANAAALLEDDERSSSPMSKKPSGIGGRLRQMKAVDGADRMMKCWTPEQDLDESSSDFDQDHDPVLPPVPSKPGKATFTLFEGKRISAVVSDTDSKYFGGRSSTDELNGNNNPRRLYGKVNKEGKKRFHNHSQNHALGNKRPQGFVGLDTNWFLSRSEPNSLNYVGIDEPDFPPNFRNKKQVIVGSRKKGSNSRDEIECELHLDEEFDSSDNSHNKTKMKMKKSKKSPEIGYGPSSMNFNNVSSSSYEDQEEGIDLSREEDGDESSEELMRDDLFDYLDQYEEGDFEREQELTVNDKDNDVTTTRPFCNHIMYLPSYDGRKVHNQKQNQSQWRRTRSVDHLDHHQKLFISKEPNASHRQEKVIIHNINVDNKVSVPSYLDRKDNTNTSSSGNKVSKNASAKVQPMEKVYSKEEEELRAQNKKKFKFQSTLRVLERKKMEEELSREAQQREEERLREMEAMKRVEEEFERKRRAKAEAEAREKEEQAQLKFFGKNQLKSFESSTKSISSQSSTPSPKPPGIMTSGGYKSMLQRQEPEGAPASVTVSSLCTSNSSSQGTNGSSDLRKELITASKKRNGNLGHTQELSEYRQETRQYCDYRSKGSRQRTQSSSPARYMQKASSSSDVFPMRKKKGPSSSYSSKLSGSGRCSRITNATVHPEVVCDIPVRPGQYVVNASRLGGSNTTLNIMSEDRSNSVLGSVCPPSPSIVSDNYRRDWARHLSRQGSSATRSGVQGQGRASSIMSLHSVPDNIRNSNSDLSRMHRERPTGGTSSSALRHYSTSPSPSPVPSSAATGSFNHMSEKSSSRASPVRFLSKSNTTVISIGPQLKTKSKSPSPPTSSLGNFQVQPYSSNRPKEFRPVSFKPPHAPTAAVK